MNAQAEERRTRMRTLLASERLPPHARIRLFPIVVGGDSDASTAMRRDTGARVRTSTSGAIAIRLLQQGATLHTVRCELAAAHGADPGSIDLAPLLDSLAYADMIRDIEGEPFSAASAPVSWWRVASTAIRARTFVWTVRYCPLSLLAALLTLRRLPRDAQLTVRISARIAVTLGRSPADADRLARRNCAILKQMYIERAILALLPVRRLERWLTRNTAILGHQHVADARAQGRGVIFCGSHFGPYSLVPFLLGRAEGPLTVLVDDAEGSAAAINRRVAEWRAAGYDCALEAVSGRMAVRTLAQRLKQRQTVLRRRMANPPLSLRIARRPNWSG